MITVCSRSRRSRSRDSSRFCSFRLRFSRFRSLFRSLSDAESTRCTARAVFESIISFDKVVFIWTHSNRENCRNVEFSNARSFTVADIFIFFTCVSVWEFINFISCDRRFLALEKRSRDLIIFDSWILRSESMMSVAEEMILSNLDKVRFLRREEWNHLIFNENERLQSVNCFSRTVVSAFYDCMIISLSSWKRSCSERMQLSDSSIIDIETSSD